MNEKKQHWEKIYETKGPEKLSWTQDKPSPSIDWILESVPDRNAGVIDVGGGISSLVDYLLDDAYKNPAVLDVSGQALKQAQDRLGERASLVEWIEADVTAFYPNRKFNLWHDRAVFHFLVSRAERELYVQSLKRSLEGGGKVIIATFSPEGPGQCSGLDVMRFDARALSSELGSAFKMIKSQRQNHTTPWGANQAFLYCLFEYVT